MTAPAHTQGPWIAKGADGRYNNSRNSWHVEDENALSSVCAPITTPDGTIVAFVVASGDDYAEAHTEFDANARLIAAAPALYGFAQFIAMSAAGTKLGDEAHKLIDTIGNHA